ncbi:hypothetical protein, partial [Aquiflexum lacus]|uniref:hypothetical protein n=1 Tax=Aquiflexum lacus TaxID=2483805 RepID=UPI001E4CD467
WFTELNVIRSLTDFRSYRGERSAPALMSFPFCKCQIFSTTNDIIRITLHADPEGFWAEVKTMICRLMAS